MDGQWLEIGFMAIGRYSYLVVSPSTDKIIIVGGYVPDVSDLSFPETLDIVEECTVT